MIRLDRSLRLRLPALIVGLLGALAAGFTLSVHRQLSRTLEHSAGTRLERSSGRILSLLAQSVDRLHSEVEKTAKDPAVVNAITSRSAQSAAAARGVMLKGATAGQPVARSLWTRDCDLVLAVRSDSAAPPARECPVAAARSASLAQASKENVWLQPLTAHGDTISYDAITPVLGPAHDTLGYFVDRRTMRDNGTGRVIAELIGKDVVVLLGNARGPTLWSDLSRRTDGPALGAARDTWTLYRKADGSQDLGVARDVPHTPWAVLVALPLANVLEPELAAMRELAAIALVTLVAALIGAWLIGRHVSSPLLVLARAADAVAGGDYGKRVEIKRRDEIGHLVSSFNFMSAQVEQASEELRTQALELELRAEESQDLAHELELSNQELTEALDEAMSARRDTTNAESLLDEVMMQSPVGIAVFDREMRYVRLNKVVADLHGIPIRDHFGKRPGEVHSKLTDLAEPLIAQVLRTGEEVLDQRLTATLTDGAERHWLASCFPIRDGSGELTGVGAMLVDTTAQQQLEAQFLQAQKMEAVGRLAGGVAHDFNNLLTVITSYSTMALGSLRPQDPLREDMAEIKNAAERAARLTRQLLAFSRKQVMQPQVISLSVMATEMERMLQRLIGEDVTLELRLADDLGAVSADPGQIEQVLMNLVVNARDAMPGGGQVIIETANVDFSTELSMAELGRPAGRYVQLTVTDTGTGMSPETQANLFEPFFTTKPAGQGTGLGLSTVYGIVKQSGGDIHIRSELGCGTSVRIFFPRLEDEVPKPVRASRVKSLATAATETVLLVEDDESLRNLAARVLRDAGYTVLDTRSATEAVLLGTHHEGTIDLLLTDVVMPQMSGRTVTELLTKQRPELRVLYMSGYTDDVVVKRGVLTTGTAFLQKPFTPEQLLQKVRSALAEAVERDAGGSRSAM
jgi:PAS domain S-box-containing protein